MKKSHAIAFVAASLVLTLAGCDRELPAPPATAVVLDVRSAEEYRTGALPGARNIPHDQLAGRAAAELPDRNAPVALYCRSGRRSAFAAETLRKLGYTRIYDLGSLENARGILEKKR